MIPTPEEYVRKTHLRGSWYILYTLYQHNKRASVFDFKNLLVGGSIYKKYDNHIIADVSGIMLYRIPSYMRPWYVGDIASAVLPSWEEKLKKTVNAALQTDKVALLGGIPTWLLTICREVLQKSDKQRLSDLWPGLQAYIHGGVNFEPYRTQFEELIDIPGFRYIEVYNATEGFFAFQDRPTEDGMLLMCADGIFYEFLSLDDYNNDRFVFQGLSDVKIDQPYVMTITTYNGLCRYVQGDIITFVTLSPFRIKVIGRVKEFINAFGEDLLASDVDAVLSRVLADTKVQIRDFTIAPSYITITDKGRHDWCIEFQSMPKDLYEFEERLDQELRLLNNNYNQKRSGDVAMTRLKIHVLPQVRLMNIF